MNADLREFLVAGLQERLQRRRKLLLRCLDDFSDDAVHAVRTNARRLLAQVELIAPLLPLAVVDEASRAVRKELKALARLRDVHVQLQHVEAMLPRHPELKSFRQHLRERRGRAIHSANRKLRRHKNALRVAQLERALDGLKTSPSARVSPGAFRRQLRRTLECSFARIIKLQRRAASQPDWLHRMRVALKSYRYMTEALPPTLPEVVAHRIHALEAHQQRTGEIHDLALLERRLAKYALRHGGSRELLACRRALDRRRLAREHVQFELTPALLDPVSAALAIGSKRKPHPARQHQPSKSQPLHSHFAAAR